MCLILNSKNWFSAKKIRDFELKQLSENSKNPQYSEIREIQDWNAPKPLQGLYPRKLREKHWRDVMKIPNDSSQSKRISLWTLLQGFDTYLQIEGGSG